MTLGLFIAAYLSASFAVVFILLAAHPFSGNRLEPAAWTVLATICIVNIAYALGVVA